MLYSPFRWNDSSCESFKRLCLPQTSSDLLNMYKERETEREREWMSDWWSCSVTAEREREREREKEWEWERFILITPLGINKVLYFYFFSEGEGCWVLYICNVQPAELWTQHLHVVLPGVSPFPFIRHFCHCSTCELSVVRRLFIICQSRCPLTCCLDRPRRALRCLPLRTGVRLDTLPQSSERWRRWLTFWNFLPSARRISGAQPDWPRALGHLCCQDPYSQFDPFGVIASSEKSSDASKLPRECPCNLMGGFQTEVHVSKQVNFQKSVFIQSNPALIDYKNDALLCFVSFKTKGNSD